MYAVTISIRLVCRFIELEYLEPGYVLVGSIEDLEHLSEEESDYP